MYRPYHDVSCPNSLYQCLLHSCHDCMAERHDGRDRKLVTTLVLKRLIGTTEIFKKKSTRC